MLGEHGRGITHAVFTAPAQGLARIGVRPNHVTIAGTIITVALAAGLLATGHWIIAPIALGIVLFADSLDGTLARLTGESSDFGAFLDSTLDRVGDGAVFASIMFALAQLPPSPMRTWLMTVGLISIVGTATVPYARARAESLGAQAKGGIAERTDRLVIALVAVFFVGVGLPLWLLGVALSWIAFATCVTVVQRVRSARRELSR
ncbi:MAG: CDP-alcohol phosphatidyltransferase family protein [Actinomycetaceae bacterium]|nr:CDP-alcohol phosphatidyltransferase family protein [Actinomycetaceae bacterium]